MAPQGVPADDSVGNDRNTEDSKKTAASPDDDATVKGCRTRSKSKNKDKREGSEVRSKAKKLKISEKDEISQAEIQGERAKDEKWCSSESTSSSDNDGNASETSEDKNADIRNRDSECPKCSAVFTEASVFHKHLISHNPPGDEKTCGICNKVLCSASSRDRHMLVHSKFKGYKCKKCYATFTTNGNMNRHRNKSVCVPIGQKIKTPKVKQVVVKQRTPSTSSEDTENIVSQPMNGSSEQESAERFQDLTNFEFSSEKFPFFAKVTCERTSKFPIISVQKYKCGPCGLPFPSQLSLEQHQSCHEEDSFLYCKICDSHFPSKSEEEDHVTRYHPEDAPSSDAEEMEQDAGDSFFARLGLQRNSVVGTQGVSKRHSFLEEARPEDGGRETEHRSDESKMDTSDDLKNDLNQNEATELAPDISADQSHFAEVNASATQQNYSDPDRDLPDVQTKIVNISPPSDAPSDQTQCTTVTSSNNDLAEITDIISNLKSVPGTTTSAENYHYPAEVERHLIDQTYMKIQKTTGKSKKIIGKSHRCPECDYQSGDPSTLKRHVRCKHKRERTFVCRMCEKTFTYKNNAERHAKSVHKFQGRESVNACIASISESSSTHSSERHFCKFCEASFENEQAQKHHVRSNSCKQKPFVCKICDTGCSTKNNCHRHILKNHPDLFKEATEEERKMIQICNTIVNDRKIKPDQTTEPIGSGSDTENSISERNEAAQSLLRLAEEVNEQPDCSFEPMDLSVRPLDLSVSNPPSKRLTDSSKYFSGESVSDETNGNASTSFQNAGTTTSEQLEAKLDLKWDSAKVKTYKSLIRQQTHRQMSYLRRRMRLQILLEKSRRAPFRNDEIAISSHTNRKLSSILKHNDNYHTKEIGDDFQMKHPVKPGLNSNSYGGDNHSDSENQDFASVRSVISTANSTKFPLEDVNYNSLDATTHPKSNGNNPFGFKIRNENTRTSGKNCRICRKSFKWRSSLERHLVKHTGEKPYPCGVCCKKFTTKSNLSRHKGTKHKRLFQQLPRSETSSSDLPQSLDGSNLSQSMSDASTPLGTDTELPGSTSEYSECRFCSTPFSNDNDLVNHMKELHVLEYAEMQGVENVLTDIKSEWKNAPPKRRK